jgi:peptidyl-Lys metalloendopeptidase
MIDFSLSFMLLYINVYTNKGESMNKHRFQIFLFVVLLAALLMTTSGVGAAPKDGPVVSLSTAQSEYRASQDVLITVTIANPTNHSVRILKWFTPANGVEEAVFIVKVNGEPTAYTGAIYKRPAATGNDYLSLKAGESVSYQVNLGDYYDLSTTGQYEITYAAASYNLYSEKGNGSTRQDVLTSEPINLKVEGHVIRAKATPTPTPPPGGNSFNACTAAQQTTLITARNQAKTYASGSQSYLGTHNSGTSRYVTWFGSFDSSRYITVKTHFDSLTNAWNNAGVNFDCGCKQNYYAYVYPNKPYNIYLCKVFWTAPMSGTDSKGGTLIHEMSHFYVVASTSDYVYGQAGAKNLAITDPAKAINNADNHEYFAENNPQLP